MTLRPGSAAAARRIVCVASSLRSNVQLMIEQRERDGIVRGDRADRSA